MKHLLLFALLTACTPDCPQPEPVVKEQLAPSEADCKEFLGHGGTTKVECPVVEAPAPVKKAVKKIKAAKPTDVK